jgi:selenocysteine-specific elongation factor
MHVICTAGHVDHGKSTLVRALTGMEPDRFAEERERGLTIDLGFAWTDLPAADGEDAGPTLAFVDLPGHERFIANMLAGAGSVELALFVVAADEGWMPQSREHLDILDLLGVRHGIVALTKADTVDADTRDLGVELVREELEGSALAEAPIVPVSAAKGSGMDELRAALRDLVAAAPAAADRGRPRLWVDRSFSIRGAGTVVTGTLAGGTVAVGDDLAVLPSGAGGRVRGLQSLQSAREEAGPGERVALNLSGIERAAVRRGDAIGRSSQWLAVDAFDAAVRVLPGREVDRRGAWHLHAGSGERVVRVFPTSGRGITGSGHLRVELTEPMPLTAGDRFVLREAGRRATVAGGTVLDPLPLRRPRGPEERAARAEELERRATALRSGDAAALFVLHLAERGADAAARVEAATGAPDGAVAAACRSGALVDLGPAVAHPAALDRWGGAVEAVLAAHHREHPVDRVAPKDVAGRAVEAAGCPGALVPAVLDALVRRGALEAEGPGLRLPSHRVELGPEQTAARERLLALLGAEPFAPPALGRAAAEAGASTSLVRELEAAGDIVRLEPDLAVLATAVEEAVARLRRAYAEEGPLTAARAKDALGTSRKYALPLLEHLDRTGRTRREGDVRVVR